MFRDSRVRDREVTASSFKTAFDQYVAKTESWFDGSVGSIDKRLNTIDRLSHSVRATVARLSTTESQPYLRAGEYLVSDRKAIVGLREAMLNGAADYRTAAPWYPGDESIYAPGNRPNDFSSREEWQNGSNLRGYLGDAVEKNSPEWDSQAGDYAVKPLEQSSQGYGTPPRVTGYPETGHPNGDPYRRGPKQWQQPQKPPRLDPTPRREPGPAKSPNYDQFDKPGGRDGLQDARLSSADRRWVKLEAAKFVAANTDTLDDSHELAERAHNHASVATSTFDGRRSASVSKAFVGEVVGLGHQTYRPPLERRAAVMGDVGADEALWL
jgi:hypothetical protein